VPFAHGFSFVKYNLYCIIFTNTYISSEFPISIHLSNTFKGKVNQVKKKNIWKFLSLFSALFLAFVVHSVPATVSAATEYGEDANSYSEGEDGWAVKANFVTDSKGLTNTITCTNVTNASQRVQVNYKVTSAVKDYAAGDIEVRVKTLTTKLNNGNTAYITVNTLTDDNWTGSFDKSTLYAIETNAFDLSEGETIEGAFQNTYNLGSLSSWPSTDTQVLTVELYDKSSDKVLATNTLTVNIKKDNATYEFKDKAFSNLTSYTNVSSVTDYKNYRWIVADIAAGTKSDNTGTNYVYAANSTHLGYQDTYAPYVELTGLPTNCIVVWNGKTYNPDSTGKVTFDYANTGYYISKEASYLYIGFSNNETYAEKYTANFTLNGVYYGTKDIVTLASFSKVFAVQDYTYTPPTAPKYSSSISLYNWSEKYLYVSNIRKGDSISNYAYVTGAYYYSGDDYTMTLNLTTPQITRSSANLEYLTDDEYTIDGLNFYIQDSNSKSHSLNNLLYEDDNTTDDNVELWLRKKGSTEFYRYYGKLVSGSSDGKYVKSFLDLENQNIVEAKFIIKNVNYGIKNAYMTAKYTYNITDVADTANLWNNGSGAVVLDTNNKTSYSKTVSSHLELAYSRMWMYPWLTGTSTLYTSKDMEVVYASLSGHLYFTYLQSTQETFSGFVYYVYLPYYFETSADYISFFPEIKDKQSTLDNFILSSDGKTAITYQYFIDHCTVQIIPECLQEHTVVQIICDFSDDPLLTDNLWINTNFVLFPAMLPFEYVPDAINSYGYIDVDATSFMRPFTTGDDDWYGYMRDWYLTNLTMPVDCENGVCTPTKYAYYPNGDYVAYTYSSQSSMRIKVKTDRTSGYILKNATTSPSTEYRYKLCATTSSSPMTDITLYGKIEYDGWRGTMQGFDLADLEKKGYTAKIYISENADAGTLEDDADDWQLYTEGNSLENVYAVAMQILDKETLEPAQVGADTTVAGYVVMQAPARVVEGTTSSKISVGWSSVENPGYVGLSGNTLTLNMQDDAVVKNFYTISTSIDNGEITPTEEDIWEYDDRTITYKPKDGYYLLAVEIDGEPIDLSLYPESYTFENLESDHTVEVITQPYLSITTSIDNGTITAPITDITANENQTITYVPEEDYTITEILVDNQPVDIETYLDSYTFTDIQENHTIEVKTARFFTILSAADENASITTSQEAYQEGTDVTFEYQPATDYYVNEIFVDDELVSSNTYPDSYTFENIQANHTIAVTTKPYVHITATIDNNGIITVPEAEYKQNQDIQIGYQPAANFVITSILVDGEELDLSTVNDDATMTSILSSYLFEDITADHSIEVKTMKLINVSASIEHGTIEGNTGSMLEGSSTNLTIQPEDGYYIDSITINGLDSEIADTVSFVNMDKDYLVSVICKPIPQEVVLPNTPSDTPEADSSTEKEEAEPEKDSNKEERNEIVGNSNTDIVSAELDAVPNEETTTDSKKEEKAPEQSTGILPNLTPFALLFLTISILSAYVYFFTKRKRFVHTNL
jgi:hypothetical protein